MFLWFRGVITTPTPKKKKKKYVLNILIKSVYFNWTNLPLNWILWFWKLNYFNRWCRYCRNAAILCSPHLIHNKRRISNPYSFQKCFQCARHALPQGLCSYDFLCLELSWPTESARLISSSAFTHTTSVRPPYLKFQTTPCTHTPPPLIYFFLFSSYHLITYWIFYLFIFLIEVT